MAAHTEAAAAGYQALAEFITRRHSYDEPEIVALPIVGGSESFLSWIEEGPAASKGEVGPRQPGLLAPLAWAGPGP